MDDSNLSNPLIDSDIEDDFKNFMQLDGQSSPQDLNPAQELILNFDVT